MAQPTLARAELVDRLGAVFRREGYEGASLARLATAAGLVKASLYHLFPGGKQEMAAAVLAASSARLAAEVLDVLAGAGPPRRRLRAAAAALGRFYAGGTLACTIDVFGIGEAGGLFRAQLAGSLARLGGGFAAVLGEAGVPPRRAARRAEDALIAIQGSLVLARATGSPAAFRRVLRELPGRLLGDALD